MKKIHIKLSAVFFALILAIVGILFFLFAKLPDWEFKYNEIVMTLVGNLGLTFISAGLVSIVLEISTIKNYIEDAIINLTKGDLPLETLSTDSLNNIHLKAAGLRTKDHIGSEELKNTIYIFEEKLLNCAENVYYEYHKQKCTIDITDDFFFKIYELDYKLINKHSSENFINFNLMLFSDEEINTQNISQLINISVFEVNNIDYTPSVYNYIKVENIGSSTFKKYDYKISFKYNLGHDKKSRVKMTMSYNVPSKDQSQVYKTNMPCKRLNHEVFIRNNTTKSNYSLNANAFTAFFLSGNQENSYFSVEQTVSSCVKISFDDWVVPGAGYVVSLNKTC